MEGLKNCDVGKTDTILLPFIEIGDELFDKDDPGDVELNESFILFDNDVDVELLHDSYEFKIGLESILFISDDDCKLLLLLFPIETMFCGLWIP